jgi:hypothetical protein
MRIYQTYTLNSDEQLVELGIEGKDLWLRTAFDLDKIVNIVELPDDRKGHTLIYFYDTEPWTVNETFDEMMGVWKGN